MPAKKAKAKQSILPPDSAAAMMEVVPGPGYRLSAIMERPYEQRRHKTYAVAGLCETAGRVGLSAFLSPDQEIICVVGGDAVRLVPTEQGLEDRQSWGVSYSISSDSGVDEPASERVETKMPTARQSLETADPVSSPITLHSPGGPQTTGGNKVLSPVIDDGPTTALPTRPTSKPVLPGSIPDEYRSCFPLVECFDIASRSWFIPKGERRRAAVNNGVVRWPTQGGVVVQWGSRARPAHYDGSPAVNSSTTEAKKGGKAQDTTTGGWKKDLPTPMSLTVKHGNESLPEDGPSSVWVIGGWDGSHRLSTVLEYNVSAKVQLPEGGGATTAEEKAALERAELVISSIPQVSELHLTPFSHGSVTLIKNRCYIFGGNTVHGATDDLYVAENARPAADATYSTPFYGEQVGRLGFGDTSLPASTTPGPSGLHPVFDPNCLELSSWDCRPVSGAATLHPRSSPWTEAAKSNSAPVSTPGLGAKELGQATPDPNFSSSALLPNRVSPPMLGSAIQNMTMSSGNLMPFSPSAAAQPVVLNTLPGPIPRSSHAAVALQDRYLVIFGGRQLILPPEAGIERSRSKSLPRSKAPPSGKKPKEKGGIRGNSKGRGRSNSVVDEDEDMLPTLQLLNDLAVYDSELRGWVRVKITGESPPPRYAAAMCELPITNERSPTVSTAKHFGDYSVTTNDMASFSAAMRSTQQQPVILGPRDMVLHGGYGENEVILSDMWILQATGKGLNGSLIEVDAETGVPTMPFRWIRVLPDEGPPSRVPSPAAVEGSGAERVSPHERKRFVPQFPSRAQHAIVATTQSEVFILGGVEPYTSPSTTTPTRGPAAPSLLTPGRASNASTAAGKVSPPLPPPAAAVHPCVTSDNTAVFIVHLPNVDEVVEVAAVHRGATKKGK